MAKQFEGTKTKKPVGKSLAPEDFVHLHIHTHHSLLDGLQKIPQMVDQAKAMGMKSIAITDHGTLSGAIEFYKSAKDAGIKPIIGIETYVASRSHKDKEPSRDKQRNHLILLAMNNIGYKNLMRLSTIANLDGYYYRPRIDFKLLEKYNEGLICLSGCAGSEVGSSLVDGDYEKAKQIAKKYKALFGDRYYLELQDHDHTWAQQKKINQLTLKLSKELKIKPVLTSDAHYLKIEDKQAHEVLLCVQTGSFLTDENRMNLSEFDLNLADPEDLIKRWSDHPDLILNTSEIANRTEIDIELGGILLPKFELPTGVNENDYLKQLVFQGLTRRYLDYSEEKSSKLSEGQARKLLEKEVVERADFELNTILKMGFPSYMLIVSDFINWGKKQGIVFGPGRGSAAGSIVSYALNITDIDPLKYDLLFERFLNPDRISMPDIDIDIQDNRRDEVIEYCIDKYGRDQVAHIATFGTMAARNAIRDTARVLELPYAEADRLAKLVPPPIQGRHIPLAESIKNNKELKQAYESSDEAKRVIDLAIKLEGTIRSHGVHAAGVVIAPDDIVNYTPLEMSQKGVIATQYSMYPIEELGLLKMDLLGLSNLTIIKNALRIVRKVWHKEIDIATIPLDDKKTFELLGRGETTGVFQLESGGMKRYLKELKPSVFDDIIAMVALYRPGPLTAGLTDKFIARKNGREDIKYDHELMETALKNTYGVLVYQEQVMQIAKDMCGFSGGEADTLRKAVGKKIRAMMEKMKDKIIDGAIENGVDRAVAERFWADLEGFADYAFNKSHAACYGLIAYQTAYLKAHYAQAFMAALMTSDFNDIERLAIDISECKHMGVEVLPPHINESFVEFGVVADTKQIRFGLAAIKNVGTGVVEEIVDERTVNGKFKSIGDFVNRVSTKVINRKVMESLIWAGALEPFGSRGLLLHNLDRILAFASKAQKQTNNGQIDLFVDSKSGAIASELTLDQTTSEVKESEILKQERALLGIYLSKHPLDGFEALLDEKTVPISRLSLNMDGSSVMIGGVIQQLKEISTKNGSKMAFVKLEDKFGEIEAIVFPDTYKSNPDVWQLDNVLLVSGKLSSKDRQGNQEELKLLVEKAQIISELDAKSFKSTGKRVGLPKSKTIAEKPASNSQKLYMLVKAPEDDQLLMNLKSTLSKHIGDTTAILVLGEDKKNAVKLPFGVELNSGLESELTALLGADSVSIK